MAQKTVTIQSSDMTRRIFGSFDSNIRRIENAFGVHIYNRGSGVDAESDTVLIEGAEGSCALAAAVLEHLKKFAMQSDIIADQTVDYVISMVSDGRGDELSGYGEDCICISAKGRPIKAKTVGQKKYVDSIRENTVVLGVGPAGTGKTFLAVAMAVKALRAHEVTRIILTRPAVEAGERLGFLPGDLQSKIDPYLRPLYDALYEMLGMENCARHHGENDNRDSAPCLYARQNARRLLYHSGRGAEHDAREQMKMFLTRLGNGSKAVVTGDLTQTDLPYGQKSGLAEAVKVLRGIDDIVIHEFSERDVVRHRLVQKIILAYEKYGREHPAHASDARRTYTRKKQ